jgi:hypothetical protein
MLTYHKLYRRIRESTGLDVLTPGTMQSIIENCDADLTGRGYRDFVEISLEPQREKKDTETDEEYEEAKKFMYESHGYGLYSFAIPEDMRRILYLKVAHQYRMLQGLRLSINSDRINNIVMGENILRTAFTDIEQQLIYYTNNGRVWFELRDRPAKIQVVRFGYDRKILIPEEPSVKNYDTTVIPIRREFEDAMVLYGIYHVFNRYSKELEKIQMALNNYKYFVEDMVATLAHEDDYDREQGTKVLEHM